MDQVTLCLVTEELGRGCAGIATSVGANTLAALPILLAGSEEQKEHYLSLLPGASLLHSVSPSRAPGPTCAIATTALADGDDYVINGLNALLPTAVMLTSMLFALTNPKRGSLIDPVCC